MSETKLDKILETVIYLKDKIDNEMATKQDMATMGNHLLTYIDRFIDPDCINPT